MRREHVVLVLAFVLALAFPVLAEGDSSGASGARSAWLAWEKVTVAAAGADEPAAEPAPAAEGPPLPFHSIEGVSGAPITPMAYLCNAGPEGTKIGKPTASYTFLNLGSKKLHMVSVTQTFLRRIELSYAWNCMDLGSLPDDIKKAGLDAGRHHVCLHHFNARLLVLPENSFGLPLPALTVGAHFKYNEGIDTINRKLGGALTALGYDSHYGMDFTLTASKTLPKLAFGRPVILTAGMRNSRAAQIGYLGFGDECSTTVEGSVACLVLDNLAVAYEFRQKVNPYDELDGLIGRETHWHAVSASWVVSNNLTVTGVWGCLGNIANARANCAWGVQVKYEF